MVAFHLKRCSVPRGRFWKTDMAALVTWRCNDDDAVDHRTECISVIHLIIFYNLPTSQSTLDRFAKLDLLTRGAFCGRHKSSFTACRGWGTIDECGGHVALSHASMWYAEWIKVLDIVIGHGSYQYVTCSLSYSHRSIDRCWSWQSRTECGLLEEGEKELEEEAMNQLIVIYDLDQDEQYLVFRAQFAIGDSTDRNQSGEWLADD